MWDLARDWPQTQVVAHSLMIIPHPHHGSFLCFQTSVILCEKWSLMLCNHAGAQELRRLMLPKVWEPWKLGSPGSPGSLGSSHGSRYQGSKEQDGRPVGGVG